MAAKGTYTLVYRGYLFEGDSAGWNFHDYADWGEIISIYDFYADAYPDLEMAIRHNEYGVTLQNGEWS